MGAARVLAAAALLALGAGAAGCRTTVHEAPVGAGGFVSAVALPERAWEMVVDTRVVGVVVEFVEQGDGGRRFFSVRNELQQELGLVDGEGRAWRYRPHETEALWLGSGTVIEGAARILGLAGEAALYEVALETLADEARDPTADRGD